MHNLFRVTEDPIVIESIINHVKREANGARVVFIGSLRGHSSDGRRVARAECKIEKEKAQQRLRDVGKDICLRWKLEDVAMCHRIGDIGVGETILVVAIGAPHRQEAFEACQHAVDRVKDSLLIAEILETS